MRGLSVVSMRPITSQGSCISELGVCPLTAFLQCPRPVLSVVGSPRSWLTDVPVCVCVCVCLHARLRGSAYTQPLSARPSVDTQAISTSGGRDCSPCGRDRGVRGPALEEGHGQVQTDTGEPGWAVQGAGTEV